MVSVAIVERGDAEHGLNARLATLRNDVMARKGAWVTNPNPFERDVALWRARQGRPLLSTGQQRARTLLELVRLAKLEIRADWRLAGEHLSGHAFGLLAPEGAVDRGRLAEFGLSDAERREVETCVARHTPHPSLYYAIGETLQDMPAPRGVFWGWGWIENHSVRDYAKVLRIGFSGIRAETEAHLARLSHDDPEYPRSEAFLKAVLWVCDAGCLLGQRYAELAFELAAQAKNPVERQRLKEMAARCERVPSEGARTFAEAVQSLWLAHILTCGEDGINANSIGRLDQILRPYYEADVAAGRLSRDDAREWMEELALKLYLDYDVQAITLGGVDRDGRDASNELTGIILDATDRVGFVRDVSVRLHEQSPATLLEQCARLVLRGGGIPFFFNDDCFVPALEEHGIALEDARDYAPIGCIELTIPGRANPHAVSGWFNSAKCLELALFDGVDPATGEQLGPRTGLLTDMADFDALYEAYLAQVRHFAALMVYHCNRGELAQREAGPLPCWSTLTDDCIARGRDITDGGAVYTYHSVCFLGTADTADALCALKRLVFDKKSIAPQTLLDALRDNFQNERLRQLLLTGAPKYGNDVEEVDAIAAQVANDFIDLMDAARSPLGGRYFVHLFSFLCNIDFGKLTGATPDGRRAGEPLAYSLSAHQGRDLKGVTALLKSLSRLPHRRAAGASAAIVDLDPKLVEGTDGITRLVQLLRTALRMGVGQLQFNVTTAERLRQAQSDPEHYGNLAVRVAGYSQMFRLLTPDLQEHVIARTKHTRG